MTDLEMTRLCAEAMGYRVHSVNPKVYYNEASKYSLLAVDWEPLKDDAQAMALVKKMRLGINAWSPDYQVWIQSGQISAEESGRTCTFNADLNRAIVECVAKMQTAKAVQP